jgi:hypothetical protein
MLAGRSPRTPLHDQEDGETDEQAFENPRVAPAFGARQRRVETCKLSRRNDL